MRNTVYRVVSEACANVDWTAGIRLFCWISDPVNRLKVITGASVENGKQAVNKPGANVMSIRQKKSTDVEYLHVWIRHPQKEFADFSLQKWRWLRQTERIERAKQNLCCLQQTDAAVCHDF